MWCELLRKASLSLSLSLPLSFSHYLSLYFTLYLPIYLRIYLTIYHIYIYNKLIFQRKIYLCFCDPVFGELNDREVAASDCLVDLVEANTDALILKGNKIAQVLRGAMGAQWANC